MGNRCKRTSSNAPRTSRLPIPCPCRCGSTCVCVKTMSRSAFW